jgi:hypothetical protein
LTIVWQCINFIFILNPYIMKKYILFLILVTVFCYTAIAQKESMVYMYYYTFDDSTHYYNLFIDPTNHNNEWQTGQPQKVLFNQAYTLPNAIVTDTIGYYRPSDTSVFTFYGVKSGWGMWPVLEFDYKFDSDTLLDFGKIEVSPNRGQTWYDIVRSANLHGFGWSASGPGVYWNSNDSVNPFTGSSANGWYQFHSELPPFYGIFPDADTVLYKVSFISDANQTNKEGWMIDNLTFYDWWEGVDQHSVNDLHVTLSPNPVSGVATIRFFNPSKDQVNIELFDSKGVKEYEQNTSSEHAIVNTQSFSSGMHMYKIRNLRTSQISTGRLIRE